MLGGQERDDARGRHPARQVGGDVAEALLLGGVDRVVGEEDMAVVAREPLQRVIHVDPGIHPGGVREPAPGGTQLDGDGR